jgi:hypothetical protein
MSYRELTILAAFSAVLVLGMFFNGAFDPPRLLVIECHTPIRNTARPPSMWVKL